jgi:hypothetical protein
MERMATHASKKIRRFPCSLIADFCNKICQKRTYAPQQKAPLFDHLVGAQQERLGEFQPKRLGGPNIDHQFDFRRL